MLIISSTSNQAAVLEEKLESAGNNSRAGPSSRPAVVHEAASRLRLHVVVVLMNEDRLCLSPAHPPLSLLVLEVSRGSPELSGGVEQLLGVYRLLED